jgi:hypothetical protein
MHGIVKGNGIKGEVMSKIENDAKRKVMAINYDRRLLILCKNSIYRIDRFNGETWDTLSCVFRSIDEAEEAKEKLINEYMQYNDAKITGKEKLTNLEEQEICGWEIIS